MPASFDDLSVRLGSSWLHMNLALVTGEEYPLGAMVYLVPRVMQLSRVSLDLLRKVVEACARYPAAGDFTPADLTQLERLDIHVFERTGVIDRGVKLVIEAMAIEFSAMPLPGVARIHCPVREDSPNYRHFLDIMRAGKIAFAPRR